MASHAPVGSIQADYVGDETLSTEAGVGYGIQIDETSPLLATDGSDRRVVDVAKDIGYFESFIYMFVQNYGFAILSVPIVFQQAGFVVTALCLLFFSIIATFAASLLTEAMAMIPGNDQFQKNIEYVGVVEHYFGRRAYYFFQFVLNTSLQTTNIASIRVTCQAVDSLILLIFKKTWGLILYPAPAGFIATETTEKFYSNDITLGISVAYVVVTVLLVPLGFGQLKDSIKVQIVSVLVVLFCVVEFMFNFISRGLHWENVPVVNTDFQQLLGVFIFSLGFASMVPSWANQKQPHVSPRVVIWGSSVVVMILNFALPLMAAFAYPNLKTDDLLENMGNDSLVVTKVAVYLYTLAVITMSIPVYCITIKNNLFTGGVLNKPLSTFVGAIAPWLVAWIFNSGSIFAELLNWASLFLTGFIAFFFPLACYIKGQHLYVKDNGKPASIIGIIPRFLLPWWKPFSIGMFFCIAIPTVFQIGLDLYYLIFLGREIV